MPASAAVTPAAQTAGIKVTTARIANSHWEKPAYRCRATAMARAATDPAVPGAQGEYPHPNHVAMSLATLTRTIHRGAAGARTIREEKLKVSARLPGTRLLSYPCSSVLIRGAKRWLPGELPVDPVHQPASGDEGEQARNQSISRRAGTFAEGTISGEGGSSGNQEGGEAGVAEMRHHGRSARRNSRASASARTFRSPARISSVVPYSCSSPLRKVRE